MEVEVQRAEKSKLNQDCLQVLHGTEDELRGRPGHGPRRDLAEI